MVSLRIFFILVFLGCACPSLFAGDDADIVYLKNGGKLSGIISKEDANTVELRNAFGSVSINRAGIKDIHHAPPEALARLNDEWETSRAGMKGRKEALEGERLKRLKAYEDWTKEEADRKTKGEREEGEIKIARDPDSKSIIVEAVLNGSVKAALIFDTGASITVLSKAVGVKLGIDMSAGPGKDVVELRLAGGQSARARMFVLKSVKIQGVEEKDVLAAVLLGNEEHIGFKDGLLGRSFLGRFNIKIDMEKMRMVLQKIK